MILKDYRKPSVLQGRDHRDDQVAEKLRVYTGKKRARGLVVMGRGVERVVQRNRELTTEQRIKGYRTADFIET
ncbi:hypothetical protein CK498_00685 [Halomonas salipaludis]|uniref:Uncharacterized protein n=1 Tax=Halomonas salipaludis TaxID=2032625 RepID=A0A2A2F313_9GAMM|nr:hypothetical protein CK498_00685 [Halomonas salipaludis]